MLKTRKHRSAAPEAALPCVLLILAVALDAARAQTGPSVARQPASQTGVPGGSAKFSVAVSGTGPFTYQWRFNGTNLPNNLIATVAGNGDVGFSGDGGPATNATMRNPAAVAVDTSGNLFVADTVNNRVREINAQGVITTIAGNSPITNFSGGYAGDGGAATNALLDYPSGLAAGASGNLFIADQNNNVIRNVSAAGIITTAAGSYALGGDYSGDGGRAPNASLDVPAGVAVDAAGNLYIADSANCVIRKVGANGIITTVAGNYLNGGAYTGDGGAADDASLNYPTGVAATASGVLFITDSGNNVIRRVDARGIITTVAGKGSPGYSGDGGSATNAALDGPNAAAVDASGNLFIADSYNDVIRLVDTNGIITTVAGNGSPGTSGDGGAATNAGLNLPESVALDPSGNLIIADSYNDRVREVFLAGLPALDLNNISAANSGEYQVVITSPYGSVTSAVATLTMVAFAIQMNPPLIVNSNLLLGFKITPVSSPSFTLLQSASVTGPWTTNSAAILSTNAQPGSYQFTLPAPSVVAFYQARSP